MRKATVVAAALLVATVCIPAAQAKKTHAVATTLYLHGSNTTDELTLGELTMTPEKPTQSVPSSKQLINYVKGPREDCVNDWTFEPTYQGPMSGHITGDVKVTLYAATSPGYVDVKLLPDFTDFMCGSKDHQPVAMTRVQLSPGT
ncbi:MAG: hypothetical protein M3290_05480, partial [Actinomycetota bacterium]|nr:hypothetical protein [Actinomycetota bacterium]